MSKYISIQRAKELANISDSTVRRWLKSLTEKEKNLHTYTQGRKILIEYSFFVQAFQIEQAKERTQLQQPGVNVQQIINNQATQIEKLLEENSRKDSELKNAFSLILSLRDKIDNLNGQIKQLETVKSGKLEDGERMQQIYIGVLVLCLVVLVIWFIRNN